jgi:hypothetical protein
VMTIYRQCELNISARAVSPPCTDHGVHCETLATDFGRSVAGRLVHLPLTRTCAT